MSQNEKDDCNCPACTLRRLLEGKGGTKVESFATVEELAAAIKGKFGGKKPNDEKQPAWMELLDEDQRQRVIKDAYEDQREVSPEHTVLFLMADLCTYRGLSALSNDIMNAFGVKDAPPFAADKMSKLRKQIKQLVDLI